MKQSIGNRTWLRLCLPVAVWLPVWQLAAMWVGQELLLPAPAAVAARLAELAASLPFWQTAGASLLRVFGGLLAGLALGVLAAVLTLLPPLDLILSPALRILRATPVASFIILVLLWLPKGQVPGFISALMVLPVVWETVSRGLREVDPKLLQMAQAYGFSRAKALRLIWLPSVLPYFAGGAVNGLGLAWKSGVAAEVLCQPRLAIGYQVVRARNTLDTPSLFAWTLTVILLSLALEALLSAALRRLKGGRTP